jgi:hypothetical protein
MLQLAASTSLLPATLPDTAVCVGEAAANPEGLLIYDRQKTPAHLALVLNALATPKVREVNDQTLDMLITAQLHKAAIRLGHKNAAADSLTSNLWATEIAQLLRERWSYFTTGEIEQVFRLGSMAQLTPPADRDGRPTEEVVYLSPKTVGVWLQRYKYQVKPQAMEHAQRLAYASSDLPPHHPVYAAWRIERLVQLLRLPPATLRNLSPREGDFKNLLYQWLKELGAITFQPKPADFWARLEKLDTQRLRRGGHYPREEEWLAVATGQREKYTDRLNAAKRWRVLCLWLNTQRTKGCDLHRLLWPHAQSIYLHYASEAQRDAYLTTTSFSTPAPTSAFKPIMAIAS